MKWVNSGYILYPMGGIGATNLKAQRETGQKAWTLQVVYFNGKTT